MGHQRWIFETDQRNAPLEDLPELVMLGHDDIRSAIPLAKHMHEGCYEFVFVESGQAGWELDGRVYTTRAGDLFHTQPNEAHAGRMDVIEPSRIWWLILRQPVVPGWLRMTDGEIRRMSDSMQRMDRVRAVGLQPVADFRRMRKALQQRGEWSMLELRTAITSLLLTAVDSDGSAVGNGSGRERIDRLAEEMRRQPEWRPSVPELAASIGMSPSYFYRMFQQATGLSPLSYMERCRIEEACRRLIQTGNDVTRIAADLGYPTSQYFATVFKRYTGTTPTAWRKRQTQAPRL